MILKGGKRPPPFLRAKWGSGGRRFKSGHPDIQTANRKPPRFINKIPQFQKAGFITEDYRALSWLSDSIPQTLQHQDDRTGYKRFFTGLKRSNGGKHTYYGATKVFASWSVKQGYLKANPFELLGAPKFDKPEWKLR